jgi:LppX_LprAFG lipoprotein
MKTDRIPKRGLPVLLFAAGLLVVCACGGDDDDDDSEATAEATVEETPQEFLASAADALEQVTSFHFLLTHENGGTEIVLDLEMERAEGDIILPDRLRADIEADGPGGLDVNVEVIAVGDQLFFENPFGGGYVDADFSLRDILDPTQGVVSLLRSAPENAEYDGTETIDGVETRRVTATIDSGELETLLPAADPGFPVEVTLWIGEEDRLVYRLLLVGPMNEDEPEDIERLIEVSDFDQPGLSIEPPE